MGWRAEGSFGVISAIPETPSKTPPPPSWWWKKWGRILIQERTNAQNLEFLMILFFLRSSFVRGEKGSSREPASLMREERKVYRRRNWRHPISGLSVHGRAACHWASRAQVLWWKSAHLALSFWVLPHSHWAGTLEASRKPHAPLPAIHKPITNIATGEGGDGRFLTAAPMAKIRTKVVSSSALLIHVQ